MPATDIDPAKTVDSRGASCPGPLMDLIGAIRGLDSGAIVRLLSDNEQSLTDVPEWAEESGNEVLEIEETEDHYALYVQKA